MEMISKESAYNAIKNVCDRFRIAFGEDKWSKGSFSAEIATCLDELQVCDIEALQEFLLGKWVSFDRLQNALGKDNFIEVQARLYSQTERSRTAEWWSIVGKTEAERRRYGQKITNFLRLKGDEVE